MIRMVIEWREGPRWRIVSDRNGGYAYSLVARHMQPVASNDQGKEEQYASTEDHDEARTGTSA